MRLLCGAQNGASAPLYRGGECEKEYHNRTRKRGPLRLGVYVVELVGKVERADGLPEGARRHRTDLGIHVGAAGLVQVVALLDEGGERVEIKAEAVPDTDAEADADGHPEVWEAVDRGADYWGDDGRLADCREAAIAVLSAIRESEDGLTKSEIIERFADEYAVEG